MSIETETFITYYVRTEVIDTDHAFIRRLKVTTGSVAVLVTVDEGDPAVAEWIAEELDGTGIDCGIKSTTREVPVEGPDGRKYYLDTFAACVENITGVLTDKAREELGYDQDEAAEAAETLTAHTRRVYINGKLYEKPDRPECEYGYNCPGLSIARGRSTDDF